MTAIPYRLANGVGNPPDARKYMANYDWLTAMLFGNLVLNGGFESWAAGTTFVNPSDATILADNWALSKGGSAGATADISRDATHDDGAYSLKINITGAGSSDSFVNITQHLPNPYFLRGRAVLFGFKVKTSTASKVRVRITDGVTNSYSEYNTGGGTFELLQAIIVVSASATNITIEVDTTSDFTGSVYMDGASAWVVPDAINAAAKAALIYSAGDGSLFTPMVAPDGTAVGELASNDIYLPNGKGIIFVDSTGRYWRLFLDDSSGAPVPSIQEVILS